MEQHSVNRLVTGSELNSADQKADHSVFCLVANSANWREIQMEQHSVNCLVSSLETHSVLLSVVDSECLKAFLSVRPMAGYSVDDLEKHLVTC